MKGGGLDHGVDADVGAGARGDHGVHGAAHGVRDAVGARGVANGFLDGAFGALDGFDEFGGGGVVWLEGPEQFEEVVASAAFGLGSGLGSAGLASVGLALVGFASAGPVFDLASGRAGFGADPAGFHNPSPLCFFYRKSIR